MYNLDFLLQFSLMGCNFACSAQQTLCHFDKLLCIYCHAHMIYMYTNFVLTSINLICSCFVHVQHHRIAGAGHPCCNRSFLSPAAPKARDGRYCNAPRPSVHLSVCPSVRLSVTFSFRTVTQKRIDVFSRNFAGTCTMSWGCAV